ncbi:MAG TPA: S41 family peptidase, partial [Candidatus Acidoferrum sp.]|nr:S41 family peptidase [Candidatus Acidoferrum sp.]
SGHARRMEQQTSPPDPAKEQAAAAMRHATAEEGKLDAAERRRVVDAAIANLRQHYIHPEVAEKMAAELQNHQKRGDYDASTDGSAFAMLLTRDLREVSHDQHLAMFYSREKTSEAPDAPSPGDLAQYKRDMEKTNCMFEKAEVLPGHIGYVKFNEFPDPPTCHARMEAAMHSLQYADAIIFDVRENHGGSPEMVALIASYLFDRPTHLNDIYNRGSNSTQESWTRPVKGNKLADKPAYVLTSALTFSAAEEFSYDLKMLKRATLVGETTRGGGHLASMQRIGDHFLISVPDANPINPISKTNWEGTGVEPDVKVKAADALQTAKALAEEKLRQKNLPKK